MQERAIRSLARRRLLVRGIVQGVGFRPFAYALARERGLSGHVRNGADGVTIEIEGGVPQLDEFERLLRRDPPPLARIDTIEVMALEPSGGEGFAITESLQSAGRTWIAPDAALCGRCRAELHDPSNRRYRHPFINCTDCGPRFTIIRGLPYDRASTTMAGFEMCEPCVGEYQDPADRRFHAQPVACPRCGPSLTFEDASTPAATRGDDAAIDAALQVLGEGGIVAVKGIGGFHLACDATNANAVTRLRQRKQRPARPFAVMVADAALAGKLIELSPRALTEIGGVARPIVIGDTRPDTDVEAAVAPRLRQLGVMLPHAPLQELLSAGWLRPARSRAGAASGALVLTSANVSGLPMLVDNAEARAALSGVADAFLLHDRAIHMRCDDSVVASLPERASLPLRRSRGYAPAPLSLPWATAPLLAVGGELKAAFCLAAGGQAFLSQHVGDMENLETLDSFTATVDHFCGVLGVEPAVYVCDAHPGYLSGQWAERAAGGRVRRIQHHHAHAASLMAEHGLQSVETLLTFCFDGTGYGIDGAIWGGEVLLAGYAACERVAHLAYAPQPGGDAAVKRPWQMALSYATIAGVQAPRVANRTQAWGRALIEQQVVRRVGTTPTSSMGRLFDGVASMLGICHESTYEGQAAAELEALAVGAPADRRYAFSIHTGPDGPLQIDWIPVIRDIARDVAAGVPPAQVAASFHDAIATTVAELSITLLKSHVPRRVGLTGGVFQNRLLAGTTTTKLERAGIETLTHTLVPPNDGGLALGQAAIAAAGPQRSW